jgi:hypothetical protein
MLSGRSTLHNELRNADDKAAAIAGLFFETNCCSIFFREIIMIQTRLFSGRIQHLILLSLFGQWYAREHSHGI